MEVAVKSIDGKDTKKKVTLSDDIFGIEPNDHAIYLDVKQYLANHRQGTHKSKERAEISGSTRKLKKQKGTGTARMGSVKSPVLRGGGRVFGPQPRDYSFKLNKKLKKLARKSALSYKVKDGAVHVIEDFSFDAPKTQRFVDLLNSFDSTNKKSLMLLAEPNKSIYLSSRNLKGSKVLMYSELNTYEILEAKNIFIVESSLSNIESLLS
jgi:large subunit ribosomal protein L4